MCRFLAVPFIAMCVFASAPSAFAGTVYVSSGTLRYNASAAETNQLRIDQGAGAFRVIDTGASITVGAGCTSAGATHVGCPVSGITSLVIYTTDQDDTVAVSSSLPTIVLSGAGDDEVRTGSGNDTVDLGTQSSELFAVESADTGAGADFVTARGDVNISLGPGADITNLLARDATSFAHSSVHGGADNDLIVATNAGAPSHLEILGEAGNDDLRAAPTGSTLVGGDGADILRGGPGPDLLQGGLGTDTLIGGDGRDAASYSDHGPVTVTIDGVANDGSTGEVENVRTDIEGVIGSFSNDTLVGWSSGTGGLFVGCGGADSITGTAGNDDVEGDGARWRPFGGVSGLADCATTSAIGADTISAGVGNDSLGFVYGADVVDGGGGYDHASFSSAQSGVTASLDDVANDGVSGQGANVKSSVEGLEGSPHVDTLTGSAVANALVGNDSADVLNGLDGNDTLCGAGSTYATATNQRPVHTDGTTCGFGYSSSTPEGSDTLNGGNGDDVLAGGSVGADVYNGGTGADTASFAYLYVQLTLSNDNVANDGAAGQGANVKNDVEGLIGGNADDILTGGALPDVLNGGEGQDILNGGGQNDLLLGGGGSGYTRADVANGGSGVDTFSYADHIVGSGGVTVTLDNIANDGDGYEYDNIKSDVENVIGTQRNDDITGSAAANTLLGRGGTDRLTGGLDNDVLDGGSGSGDLLFGEDGIDYLLTRDGNTGETADCGGGGPDRAITDSGDVVSGCETSETGPAGLAVARAVSRAGKQNALGARTMRILRGARTDWRARSALSRRLP